MPYYTQTPQFSDQIMAYLQGVGRKATDLYSDLGSVGDWPPIPQGGYNPQQAQDRVGGMFGQALDAVTPIGLFGTVAARGARAARQAGDYGIDEIVERPFAANAFRRQAGDMGLTPEEIATQEANVKAMRQMHNAMTQRQGMFQSRK